VRERVCILVSNGTNWSTWFQHAAAVVVAEHFIFIASQEKITNISKSSVSCFYFMQRF
jgi:hypothetical protein